MSSTLSIQQNLLQIDFRIDVAQHEAVVHVDIVDVGRPHS